MKVLVSSDLWAFFGRILVAMFAVQLQTSLEVVWKVLQGSRYNGEGDRTTGMYILPSGRFE